MIIHYIFVSTKDVVFWVVFVRVGAALRKSWMDFNETYWEDVEWTKKEPLEFWCGCRNVLHSSKGSSYKHICNLTSELLPLWNEHKVYCEYFQRCLS